MALPLWHKLLTVHSCGGLCQNPGFDAGRLAKQPQESPPHADSDDEDDAADKIWTLRDLRVLHELHKPVAVVVSGVYEDPHRFAAVSS